MRVTCYLLDYLVRLLPQKRVWANLLNWISSLKRFKSFNTIRGFFTASWITLIDQKERRVLFTVDKFMCRRDFHDGWLYPPFVNLLWMWMRREYQENFKIQKDGVAGQQNGENKGPLTPFLKRTSQPFSAQTFQLLNLCIFVEKNTSSWRWD